MLLNEGKLPFEFTPETGSRLGKKEVAKRNRKYYNEVGLKSHLRKACPKCGRRTACNHRSFGSGDIFLPNKPIVLGDFGLCVNCSSSIMLDHTVCPKCHEPNPFTSKIKKE